MPSHPTRRESGPCPRSHVPGWKPRAGPGSLSSDPCPALSGSPRALTRAEQPAGSGCGPPSSAPLPFILTWNSPKWASSAPSRSHMSCKAPHRTAEHYPRLSLRPCPTEARGQNFLGTPKAGSVPPPSGTPTTAGPPQCTLAGCGPAPAGSLGRRGLGGTWRRHAACWRRRLAGGTGYSSPRRVRPPARGTGWWELPKLRAGARPRHTHRHSPSGRGHPFTNVPT